MNIIMNLAYCIYYIYSACYSLLKKHIFQRIHSRVFSHITYHTIIIIYYYYYTIIKRHTTTRKLKECR